MDKLKGIRKALEAATPGPWERVNAYDVFTPEGADNRAGITADANDGWHICEVPDNYTFANGEEAELSHQEKQANAHLIAHAPEYITYLLQLVETQAQALEEAQNERFEYEKLAAKNQEEASRLRRALGWYANEGSWIQGEYQGGLFFTVAEIDGGQRAREALT